jgi:hypothetical protein
MSASPEHERIVRLFEERPGLAVELLGILGVQLPALPAHTAPECKPGNLSPAEFHADAVVTLPKDPPGSGYAFGIIVEVQRNFDQRKLFTWPSYYAQFRARYECPVCLLIITAREDVAAWCRRPIQMGPHNVFTADVLGPAEVPLLDDEAAIRRALEVAVLSCFVHGQDPNAEAVSRLANTTLAVAKELLPNELLELYSKIVVATLSKRAVEMLMATSNHEYVSEFAKMFYAEGEAKGKVEALLSVLESRGLRISPKDRERILACKDQTQLDAWIRKAVSVATVDELS